MRRDRLFLNGESHRANRAGIGLFTELVNARGLELPRSVDDDALELLHGWYVLGWLTLGEQPA